MIYKKEIKKSVDIFQLVLILLLTSCQSPMISTEIWQQKGFGRMMKIDGDQFSIFVSTDGFCREATSGTFNDHFRIVEADLNKLIINYGSTRNYHFSRIEGLPAECTMREDSLNLNPVDNFNALWNLFNDNYAFFEHRNVDWDKIREDYMPMVENVSSQTEFYGIIKAVLDSLNDGHVTMRVPDSVFTETREESIDFETVKNEIPDSILDTYMDAPKTYNFGTISWGQLKGTNVGYIIVPRMFGFPNYGLTEGEFNMKLNEVFNADPGPGYEYFMDEEQGVHDAMEEIYTDLSETDSIIFDLRFNQGGFNGPAMAFLSHFIIEPYDAHIRTINTNTLEPLEEAYHVEPATENVFEQPIYLFTSHWSASAAEIFVLSSMQSEHISRYGSNTRGLLSEVVWAVLPNGWEVSMSVDIVSDLAGNIYEVTGIPVDYSMNYSEDITDFYNSFYRSGQFSDPLIETFIE